MPYLRLQFWKQMEHIFKPEGRWGFSSETLSPVRIAVRSSILSRRPILAALSGASSRALISSGVRNSMGRFSKRLPGMARIWQQRSAHAGSLKLALKKKVTTMYSSLNQSLLCSHLTMERMNLSTAAYYENKHQNTPLFINSCLTGHNYSDTFYCSYVNLCNF